VVPVSLLQAFLSNTLRANQIVSGIGINILVLGATTLAYREIFGARSRAEIPGLAEAIRFRGTSAGIPTAALSRGLAGLAGQTLIVNLPGSPGGCRDGLAVLDGVLVHAVDQIHGGDHPGSSAASSDPSPAAVHRG
jgi:hypothetical protein